MFSAKGLSRGLGEKSSPGPGCFCTPCPSKPETKLRPPASARASGHGGGGGEAESRVADSFLLSSTLFEGRAPRLFQLPSPHPEKEKDTWEMRSISSSSFFNNARCLPSDRSELGAGWAIEGPREIRNRSVYPERETHCAVQTTFVVRVFILVPVFGVNFPHLITFWSLWREKEGDYRLHANPGRHPLSFDNGLVQGGSGLFWKLKERNKSSHCY